jgi:hypothetical protein
MEENIETELRCGFMAIFSCHNKKPNSKRSKIAQKKVKSYHRAPAKTPSEDRKLLPIPKGMQQRETTAAKPRKKEQSSDLPGMPCSV